MDSEEAQAVTSCLFRTPAYELQGAAKGGREQQTAGTERRQLSKFRNDHLSKQLGLTE